MDQKFFNIGEIIRDNFGQEYCFVSDGTFLGGEDGQEEMEVKAPFYLARNPLPVALFEAFLKDSGHDFGKQELDEMNTVSSIKYLFSFGVN